MKTRFLILIVSIFVANITFAQNPTTLFIEYLSAQEQGYELAKLGRLEFSVDLFRVVDKSGSVIATGSVADVKKMTFDNSFVGTNLYDDQSSMVVYPNPAMDVLCVEGLKEDDVLRVYSIEGLLLKTIEVSSVQILVEVGDLPNGTYLLQSNTQIVKFIKK